MLGSEFNAFKSVLIPVARVEIVRFINLISAFYRRTAAFCNMKEYDFFFKMYGHVS